MYICCAWDHAASIKYPSCRRYCRYPLPLRQGRTDILCGLLCNPDGTPSLVRAARNKHLTHQQPYSIPLRFADCGFRILGEDRGSDATHLKKASAHTTTLFTGSAAGVTVSSSTDPGSPSETSIGCNRVQYWALLLGQKDALTSHYVG
jgi:hypothetical protein